MAGRKNNTFIHGLSVAERCTQNDVPIYQARKKVYAWKSCQTTQAKYPILGDFVQELANYRNNDPFVRSLWQPLSPENYSIFNPSL